MKQWVPWPASCAPDDSTARRTGDARVYFYTVSYEQRWQRQFAVGLVVAVAVLSACSGSDSAPDAKKTVAPSAAATSATVSLVEPDEFAAVIAEAGVEVINVHVPYEGEIDGTDAFVPFDAIGTWDELPDDLSTPIAVYCRSGNMSADASAALVELGYTNVVDLDGGMNAWSASGRSLEES